MAQIIKIQDCISRYEQDPYHYINQFIRLKKQRWQSIKEMAEKKKESIHHDKGAAGDETVGKRKNTFTLKRKKKHPILIKEKKPMNGLTDWTEKRMKV